KARQAQSKLKQIDRLKEMRVEVPRSGRRTLGFEFLKPKRSGRVVVETEGLEVAVPGRTLLHDVSFAIERGEHISLVGASGAGKRSHTSSRAAPTSSYSTSRRTTSTWRAASRSRPHSRHSREPCCS